MANGTTSANITGNNISQPMKCFLDAVLNPFTATVPCQVPDGFNQNSITLQDWIDRESIYLNAPEGTSCSGMIFQLMVGDNILTGQLYGQPYLYVVVAGTLDETGVIQKDNTGTAIPNYGFTNYNEICGQPASYNAAASLVDSFRIFSGGLRVLPTIEMITSSDTPAVACLWAGLMTPQSIWKAYEANNEIYDVVRAAEHMQEYSNSQGCSVRLDPFGIKSFLDMRTLSAWNDSTSYDTSLILFPTICVRFTQNIDLPSPYAATAAPIRLHSQVWMEAQLVQPTPIIPTRSPVDLHYDTIIKAISNSPELYPVVATGHSFRGIRNGAANVNRAISKLAQVSSGILPNPYGQVARRVATISTAIQPLLQPRRRRNRRANNQNGANVTGNNSRANFAIQQQGNALANLQPTGRFNINGNRRNRRNRGRRRNNGL